MKLPHPIRLAALALAVAPLAVFADQEIPLPEAPVRASEVTPLYIGTEIMPVDAPTRELFKLPKTGGLFIIGIAPGSPAAGKLGQGDILLKLDGQVLVTREQLRRLIRARKAGDDAVFTVVRGGRTETVTVKPAAMPAGLAMLPVPGQPGAMRADELLRELTERMHRDMHGNGLDSIVIGNAEDDMNITLPDTPGASVSFSKIRRVKTAEGSVTVTEQSGKKTAVVKDSSGKAVYSGPYSETEAKIPAWAHRALKDGPQVSVSISGGIHSGGEPADDTESEVSGDDTPPDAAPVKPAAPAK